MCEADGNCVQVVQIYRGEAEVQGGIVEARHPGYLWLYADGTFGFLTGTWLEDE